jgi:hypothetical protein
MFVRVKTKGLFRYLKIVENHWEGKRTVQGVLATLGRADELMESCGVDILLKSLGRFDKGKVHGRGEVMEEMGTSAEQLLINEVSQEGTVGAAGFSHGTSRDEYYFSGITIS